MKKLQIALLVGLDYKLTERLTLNAEYAELVGELGDFSLGAVFSF